MPFKQFHIKSVVLFLLLLITGAKVEAQVYPVQVTVIPTPPHRNYLNSFSEQGALNVFVTLTDFNSGPISVKLKFTLNGPGYQFRSLPNNLVYVLNPGQPTQIPMEDLAVFFSSTGQSLNFNPSKLPEGNSSICIDVIKNQSGELLSNNGCGYFYMGYGQPASLLQPACNSTIQIPAGFSATTDLKTIPLQFNFSPALAPIGLQQEVENTLYIYNWLGTVNNNPPLIPIGLPLAMDPIELGQITAHTLLPINNQLIVGQEYVWYVKSTLNGSTNQFQNGGWSIPCKFKYGEAQSIEESLAQGLSVEWINLVSQSESKGAASWKVVKEDPNSSATFNQFILKYRRKVSAGQEPYEWFSDTVNDLSKAIYQLEPATTYEASVAGKLGSFVSTPTEIRTFTTAPPRTFSCGVANFPGRATAFQPLQFADPGMKVKIGMFQLEFVSVQNTGQPGRFSGTGLIPVDFLFGAEARVKFDNLKIDKEYDVWEGTAHVITDGLDAWLEDQYQQFQDPIFVNGTVDSAYVSDSLAHVVIDGVDTTFTFPCTTCPVIINDVAGNQITIYPNGTVIWSSYLDISNEQLDVPNSKIASFEQNNSITDNNGGFDPYAYSEWNASYEIIRTKDTVNYFVANKSLIKGQLSKINVSVPENNYTENNVKLSWSGLPTPLAPASSSTSNGKRLFVFNLPVFNNEDEFAIYAVSDSSKKIGKLNVTVFELLQKKVVVVPIAGTVDGPQLSTYLKKTLGEAGINFTVSISDTIGVGKYASNSSINIPDATLMTKYSGKMRQIRNSYFDKHESEDDTYYLFVVSSLMDTVNNLSADGYMVRGKSIGFIQNGASLQTFAHELGHGMGALEHTWKDNGPERGSTNNLMDYAEGENLILAQWKALRDPKGNSFWDEEEDGENFTVQTGDLAEVYAKFKNDNGTITFIDPSGGYVTLPPGVKSLTFASPDSYWINSNQEVSDHNIDPIGSLSYFTLSNDKVYYAHKTNSYFTGYYTKENSIYYLFKDTVTTLSQIKNVLGGIPVLIDGAAKFKILPLNKESILSSSSNQNEVGGKLIPEYKFSLLNNYLTPTSSQEGIIVLVSYQGGITLDELNYIKNIKSTVEGADAVYAFELAYLLKKNPIFKSCFSTVTSNNSTTIQNEILESRALEGEIIQNQYNVPESDETSVQIQSMYASVMNQIDSVSSQEILNNPNYFKELFLASLNWISAINKLSFITKDALTDENIDIGGLSDKFFKYSTYQQRLCYLSKLSSNNRARILSEAGEWTLGSQKEYLLVELLISTPKSQYEDMLAVLANNNYSILRELDGDLWNANNFALYATIGKWVSKIKNLPETHVPVSYISNPNSNLSDPSGFKTVFLGQNMGVFVQQTDWNYYGTKLYFSLKIDENGQHLQTDFELDPYEPVIVVANADYTFAGLNGKAIKEGDKFLVPAIFAYWLIKEKEKISTIKLTRQVFDVIAVAASVLTTNPGPILIVDGIIGGIDFVIADLETNILNNGTQLQKDLLADWNQLVTVVGVLNGVYGITKVIDDAIDFKIDRAIVNQKITGFKNNLSKLDELQILTSSIFQNSKQNLFQRGYTNLRDELSGMLRRIEINRATSGNSNITLLIEQTGDQNLVKITHSGTTHNLAYLDPDLSGKVIYSGMNFIESNSSEIAEVLQIVEGANFKKSTNLVAYNKKFTIVKTNSGLVKVVDGVVSEAGSWLPTTQMRTLTNDWASFYRQGLTSNTQLSKFNKACTARWKNATNTADEIFYGRNGGILNTQSSFPTISAEKGLGIHPTLQSKLPANTQWPNVANCAECDAVNQALWKGAKWDEIQIHTIDIRPDGTMTDVIQCLECLNIFSGMRVTSQ
ncbi:hypothetical protein [Fluviicola taffensis]|uniref:Fibronectin type-III domain-containing protein n=1 Tax=Fluviicola taffensis (strain DSM 16823 / NCIMB 13979 / RW262) TaxID=755732 RepID=F2IDH8_FLUTR|nr:hypothetical protein [Fluviicola taffensis]AEA42354.1 hypothetical protein Fluta_0346 [Fluviicola taffensis DSM 16823]